MLAQFYTDFCLQAGKANLPDRFHREIFRARLFNNLLGRVLPPELQASDVTTLPVSTLIKARVNHADLDQALREYVLKDNFHGANAVYSIINGDLEVLQQAKSRGLMIVHDHILTPDVGLILREEREKFAGFEKQDSEELVWHGIERDRAQWQLVDLVLAPSEYSRNAIVELGGPADRIAVVPYGISEDWLQLQTDPQPGRILFVGTVGLRKGIHYLAEATRILQQRKVPCEVIIAGRYDVQEIRRPEFQGPVYLGQVPRSEIKNEYLKADVFVHPSLAEGCAIAHLEALACGLPVITTPTAGPVFRDGEEGYIVPPRDAATLADRVETIIKDRELRSKMSEKARILARNYTLRAYSERLATAINRFSN